MKKYIKKNKYGYDVLIFDDCDIEKKYFINFNSHGYYYYWCGSEKTIWCYGYYNMGIEYSHWKELYIELKYYL